MKKLFKNLLLPIIFIFFICALCLHETDTYAQASAGIIIKDSSDATAKKFDKQLKKGKKITLKIKGSQKTADKTINSLRNRIRKINGTGVVFQYTKGSTSGSYCTYDISADDAKLYGYSIKFINKLYKYTIKKIKSREGYEKTA